MKATGIVRRIDDLGRVVIPKEIRRTLRIRESDPLEIFTDREGEIVSVNKRVLYIRAAFLLPSVSRDNGEKRKKFWYLPENNDKITFCERV
mgnify:CR=1 FL=1